MQSVFVLRVFHHETFIQIYIGDVCVFVGPGVKGVWRWVSRCWGIGVKGLEDGCLYWGQG